MRQKLIKEWLATTEEDGDEDGVQAVTQAFALVREFPMRAPPCLQSPTSEPSSKGSKKAADHDGATGGAFADLITFMSALAKVPR